MTKLNQKILLQQWTLLIISSVAAVWYLIVGYMAVLRLLFTQVKGNSHGAIEKMVTL